MSADKHGFNVDQYTKVTISTQTPQPREETIKVIRDTINCDESIQCMRDRIKEIVIDRRFMDSPDLAIGQWFEDGRLVFYDNGGMNPKDYEIVVIHELDGHAFFQWAFVNRWKQYNEFCKVAWDCKPATQYIADNEVEWRKEKYLYENEQHSAIAELDHELEFGGTPYHVYLLCDEKLDELLQLYRALHAG